MSNLYTLFREVSRVQETVTVTTEGVYKKDRQPADYGGPLLSVKLCHYVRMADATGAIVEFEFSNEEPLNQDGTSTPGPITIDGTPKVLPVGVAEGTGDPRTWTTKKATRLVTANQQAMINSVEALIAADGPSGTSS